MGQKRGANDFQRLRLYLLTITFLAFGLRVVFIEQRTATIDEIASLKWIGSHGLMALLQDYHTNVHLLTTVLAWLIDALFGQRHWLTLYRAPSLIFGILTVPLTYQLGRCLFNRQVGVLAGLLVAVAPFHIDFSIQMRGYAATAFWASVIYLNLWYVLQKKRSLTYWLALALASILAVYAHLFGALAVGASWLIILATYFWRRREQSPAWSKQMGISLMLMLVCLAVLYGPLLGRIVASPTVEPEWGTQIEPLFVDGRLHVAALDDYLKVLRFYGPLGEPRSWFVLTFVILAGVGLGGTLLNCYPKQRHSRLVGSYLLTWIFAPMVVTSLGLQFVEGFYVYRRFFIFFQPLYLLLMAAGMLVLGELVMAGSRRIWLSQLVTASLILAALGGAGWKLYQQTYEDIDSQWHRVAQTILQQDTNPLVICEAQGQASVEKAIHKDECMRNLTFYLQPTLNQDVPWLHQEIDKIATIPEASRLPNLEQQAGTVWVVLWQRDWPSLWPKLLSTPRLDGFVYYVFGSTLVIQVPEQPVHLLALTQSVDPLLTLETTPQDRFSYYLSQAQMKAISGDRETARQAWLAAAALSPDGINAEDRLRAVAELIGMTELLAQPTP